MAYTQVALLLLLPPSFASFPHPFQQMLYFHCKEAWWPGVSFDEKLCSTLSLPSLAPVVQKKVDSTIH